MTPTNQTMSDNNPISLVNYNDAAHHSFTPTPKYSGYHLPRRGIPFSPCRANPIVSYHFSCSRHPLCHVLCRAHSPVHLYRALYLLRASPRVCRRRFQCRRFRDAFIASAFVYLRQSWYHSYSLSIPIFSCATPVRLSCIIVHHTIHHNNLSFPVT
jgi:hypothetical protein